MKFEIETVAYHAFSYEICVTEYFLPEKPLLLRGVDVPDASTVTTEYVKNRFLKDEASRPGWVLSGPVDDDVLKTPSLVKQTLARHNASLSENPMRVFLP